MENIVDKPELLEKKQKLVRAAGIILFIGALGLAVARVISALLSQNVFNSMDAVTETIVSDVIFTLIVQACALLLGPFLVYKLYLKGETKNFLRTSNVRKSSWSVCILAVVVGLLAPALSMTINYITSVVFLSIGVSIPSSETILPETFNFWVLLLNVVLTAVFPGFCEEIFNRGIVLSGIRSMFPQWATILLGGMIFGLFHQYIFQTFYTCAFGMIIVYIVLKTKSTVPAIIIHFTNNFVAVLTDFAFFYEWDFFSLQTLISKLETTYVIPALILGVGGLIVAIVFLIKCDKANKMKEDIDRLEKAGIKVPENGRPISFRGLGGPLNDVIYYKPTLKDTVFYWGALVIAVLSTVFTLFWYML